MRTFLFDCRTSYSIEFVIVKARNYDESVEAASLGPHSRGSIHFATTRVIELSGDLIVEGASVLWRYEHSR